jgi:hypothetical protein
MRRLRKALLRDNAAKSKPAQLHDRADFLRQQEAGATDLLRAITHS